jgi:uncharacterized protein with ATP-grasp and redox domains
MRLDAECYPCMISQALRAAGFSGLREDALSEAVRESAAIIGGANPRLSPPAVAALFYDRLKDLSGVNDPYRELKWQSNARALDLLPRLRSEAEAAPDPLVYAVKASIAGNIIDFGARADPADLEENLRKILESEPFIDHVENMREDLKSASDLLLICDNAGEIVMDRLLFEVLSLLYPGLELTAAVRGGPAINDATKEDAQQAGLDRTCAVIDTGTAMAGIDLDRSSPGFREAFERADVILSKGQGNYETLDQRDENIYFLFQVKCGCVSRNLGAEKGAAVIRSLRREQRPRE